MLPVPHTSQPVSQLFQGSPQFLRRSQLNATFEQGLAQYDTKSAALKPIKQRDIETCLHTLHAMGVEYATTVIKNQIAERREAGVVTKLRSFHRLLSRTLTLAQENSSKYGNVIQVLQTQGIDPYYYNQTGRGASRKRRWKEYTEPGVPPTVSKFTLAATPSVPAPAAAIPTVTAVAPGAIPMPAAIPAATAAISAAVPSPPTAVPLVYVVQPVYVQYLWDPRRLPVPQPPPQASIPSAVPVPTFAPLKPMTPMEPKVVLKPHGY